MSSYIPRHEFFDVPSAVSSNSSLQDITNAQEGRFAKYVDPVIQEQLESLNSTEMVDDAIASSEKAFEGAETQNARMTSRLGVQMTPAQLQAFRRRLDLARTTSGINTVQGARVAQEERRSSIVADLSNKAQGLSSTGTSGLANAYARDTARKNANDAQSTQFRSSLVSGAANLGAAAIIMGI